MASSLWNRAVAELSENDQRIFRVGSANQGQILRDILLAVESQRDRCQRGRWKTRRRNGQEIIIRDVCAKIVACVQKFLSVVDVAVSFDQAHAALPWAGVRAEVFDAMVEGLEKASSMIARCNIVESLYLHGDLSNVQSALQSEIKKLYGAILNFLCKTKKYYDSTLIKRVGNLTTRQNLEFAVKMMDEAERSFQMQKGLVDGESRDNEYVRRPTLDEYERRRRMAEHDGEAPGPLTIAESAKMCRKLGRTSPTIIVIDALDECDSRQRRLLLSALDEISSRSRDIVKIFVSSRDETDIAVYFSNGVTGKVTATDNAEDFRRFVEKGTGNFIQNWSVTHDETPETLQHLKVAIIGSLLEGARGIEDRLLSYAAHYWPAHLEDLGDSAQRTAIKPLLTNFFTKEEHLEDWLDSVRDLAVEEGSHWSSSLERKLDASLSSPPSALFVLCCFGLIEVLKHPRISEQLNLEQRNEYDTSGLYLAARWGHTKVVAALLSLGVDVDSPGFQYGTALHAAAFAGHDDVVKLLLDSGASMSSAGEFPSPLKRALANGNASTADNMLDCNFQFSEQIQFDQAMEIASFKGYVDIVQRLLRGQAGNFAPQDRPEPLQVALYGGKARKTMEIIQKCADINEAKGYFGNAIQAAIAGGKCSLVKSVVEAGARLDQRGRFGYPLRAAVVADKIEIVRYLLDKGADPNAKDDELGDALQAAASKGNLEIMVLLLDSHAVVEGRGGFFGNTLQAAVFGGHELAVRLLLDCCPYNKWGPNGRYRDALQAAVYAGHSHLVEYLIGQGGELNPGRHLTYQRCSIGSKQERASLPGIRERTGQFDIPRELGPLEIAARHGNIRLIHMLISEGARVDAPDADSQYDVYGLRCAYTALQIAAFWGHIAAVDCLLCHGADPNAVRQTLGTPLQAALEGSNFDIADLLLARGAKIDKYWGAFGSCLQVFCERGEIQVVEYLFKRGACIGDRGGEHGNALQVASDAGQLGVVRALLDHGGIDINAPGKLHGSALQAASASGQYHVVELLLDNKAKLEGDALVRAAAHGHEEVLRLLLQRAAIAKGATPPGARGTSSGGIGDSSDELDASATWTSARATSLHRAAYYGHVAVVSLLVEDYRTNVHLECEMPSLRGGPSEEWGYNKRSGIAMFAACYQGFAAISKLLFLHDPWGYVKRSTFAPALEVSLAYKRQDVVVTLVHEAVGAGFKPEQFDYSFEFACKNGHAYFVDLLLNYFSLANWPNSMSHAATGGKGDWIEVIRILIDARAALDELKGKAGDLRRAIAKGGKMEALKLLELRGCCLLPDIASRSEALIVASQAGQAQVVRHLCGSRVPSASDVQVALLATSTSCVGNVEVVKALLSLDVALNWTDDKALRAACERGHTEIVRLLLQPARQDKIAMEAGLEAAVNHENMDCAQVILEFLDEQYDRSEICTRMIPRCLPFGNHEDKKMSYLLGQGAHPDSRNSYGETMLYTTAKSWFPEGLKALLQHGANPNLNGGEHGTALHAAAVSGSVPATQQLVEAGANVNNKDSPFGTPLMAVMAQTWYGTCLAPMWRRQHGFEACLHWCHCCCARIMLDAGSDIDAQGGFSGTALQAAAKAGNLEGVEMLLARGADVTLRCGENGSALGAATSAGPRYCSECDRGKLKVLQPKQECEHIIQVLLDAGVTDISQSWKM
ncbi:MAG: hypothetical protein Q9160_008792 [Pyrenula sp. 1 TL-2023]